MKKYLAIVLVLVMTSLMFGCGAKEEPVTEEVVNESVEAEIITDGPKPVVTFKFDEMEDIQVELYPEIAPNTVNNFISLVQEGYYDGLIFHRVIEGFMIQGGDPEGSGKGGPGYAIKGEFTGNGFENPLSHERGVLSMARAMAPDSAGSQFFIMHQDVSKLDGQYAAFGRVIQGIETVDQIATVETDLDDRPTEDVVMKEVTIELNGYEPQEPEKIAK